MPKNHFYDKKGQFPLKEIIKTIGFTGNLSDENNFEIRGFESLINADVNDITFLNSSKYKDLSLKTKAAACITSPNLSKFLPKKCVKIDVVVPLQNEEGSVDELISRLQRVVQGINYNFEFIIVDDGSKDGTLQKLLDLQSTDHRIKLIQLSRNWGQQNAYNAGIDHATGDAVVLMDGDLEDPPEIIPEMIKKWEEGYHVVCTVKKSRQRNLFYKFMFNLFYKLLRLFSDVPVDQNAGMFSLIDKKALGEVRKCLEKNKYYVGLRSYVGFKHAQILYHRGQRFAGKPKQSFKKLLNYASNGLFSFSFLPIRLLTTFGFVLMLALFLMSTIMVAGYFLDLNLWFLGPLKAVPGWTSIILVVFFVLAIQIVFMGVLGEYIARIFDEVRNRPYYIVEKVYEGFPPPQVD